METPQNHYLKSKEIENFILHLLGRKQTQQTFKLALFSPAHDYNRAALLLSENDLDPDLAETLATAANHILAQQITRLMTKQYAAEAMINASATNASGEKARKEFVQKTIFEIGEQAREFINKQPYPKK